MKYYRDLKNVIDKSYDDGKLEGISEGEIIGIEKTAISMIKEGFEVTIISKITCLTVEKVQ